MQLSLLRLLLAVALLCVSAVVAAPGTDTPALERRTLDGEPHTARRLSVACADPCLGCFAAKCAWDETCKPATCVKKPHPGPKRESPPVPRATLPLTLGAACHPKCDKGKECRDGHCIKKYTPPVHQPKSESSSSALTPLLTRRRVLARMQAFRGVPRRQVCAQARTRAQE